MLSKITRIIIMPCISKAPVFYQLFYLSFIQFAVKLILKGERAFFTPYILTLASRVTFV